ncbi:MAG: DNA polymerase III subunit delta, partial [Candidatus Cloacimonetes bacterium]|nr:DNA polymerase III subunit delta [Candidatus Cloacimonadota bacterium]
MKADKIMRHYEFLQRFSNLRSSQLYVIFGSEGYIKDQILHTILEHYGKQNLQEFDLVTLYGDNTTALEICEQLEMMPFISDKRIIVVKNFDMLKSVDNPGLEAYLHTPSPTSLLVLTCEKFDARTRLNKIMTENGIIIECRQPFGTKDLLQWLRAEIRQRKLKMKSEAVETLANLIDSHFLTAASELEKLILFKKNEGVITEDDVYAVVGKTKANSIFELQDALGIRDRNKAFQILENLIENYEPAAFIMIMLNKFFTRLWSVNALRKKKVSDQDIINHHLTDLFKKYRGNYLRYADAYNDYSLCQ